MIALIDGDIIVYRIGFTTDNDPEWIARSRAKTLLNNIRDELHAEELRVYLSDSLDNNFRYRLWSGYKANRLNAPKPVHYDVLKEYLVLDWDAKFTHYEEADDRLGIEQCRMEDTIICSIDKDLLQIPGWHYNIVKKEKQYVTPEQGLRWFYKQVLMGDVTENVKGLPGVGSVRADKILGNLSDEAAMFKVTRDAYKTIFGEDGDEELLQVGRMLKIRTRENEVWSFPKDEPSPEFPSSFIDETLQVSTQSTELGGTMKNGS